MDGVDGVLEQTEVRHYAAVKPRVRKGAQAAATHMRMALFGIYVVPFLVITFLYVTYIYPLFTASGQEEMALGISAVLTFAVIISILGLALMSKSSTENVDTLKGLNERMDSLLAVTKNFEETKYVDTLVDSIARSSKDLLDAEASSLLLYDDEGGLRFEYVEGPASRFLKGKAVKLGEGITGWAALEKRPVIINDVQSDPRFAVRFDKGSGFITESIICVPLSFAGRELGILEAINKRGGDGFTPQDQEVLVSLAEHASAAIFKNKTYDEMKSDFVQILELLITAMENFMPEKKGHARRVAKYSIKLAKEVGLNEDEVRKVYFGALLHDIGLLKFDIASYQDREKYKLHPSMGGDIVKNINQWKDISQIVRDHHERYDGTGYPSGARGPDITLGGRIVGLIEAFDVMTYPGGYKPSISFEDAVLEIRSLAGFQFDPMLADVFARTFRKEDLSDGQG